MILELAAALLITFQAAPAEEAAPAEDAAAEPAATEKAPKEELICRRRVVAGEGLITATRTRKICKTKAEWDAARR